MSIRTSTISLALSLMVPLAVGAYAEPLAKNGTGTAHSGWIGIGTTTPTGDKRMYWTGTYWGMTFNDDGKGPFHRVAWNCPEVSDIHENMVQTKGSCTATDTDGDKFYGDWTGKGPVGGEFASDLTFGGGTGKYARMRGNWEFHCWGIGTNAQLYCWQNTATSCRSLT